MDGCQNILPGDPHAQILEVLQMVLSAEDLEKYRLQFVPASKSDEASRAHELANKCREQTKLENHLMLCDPGYGE